MGDNAGRAGLNARSRGVRQVRRLTPGARKTPRVDERLISWLSSGSTLDVEVRNASSLQVKNTSGNMACSIEAVTIILHEVVGCEDASVI